MESIQILLPLALILIAARAAGALSQRLGMPGVLGELLAGLILGPSLLGLIQLNEVIIAFADIGVLLLMFIAGLETDLLQLRRVGSASTWAAIAGVALPFVGGLAVGQAFGLGWPTSLFLGAVLTATSVSVSVQTFSELGRLKSREGLVTLGAAIIDDVLGILVLSVVLATVGQGGNPWLAVARIALFFPVALIAGRFLVEPIVNWADRHHVREAGFALIVVVVLVYAWSAEALGGLAAITGAYMAGVIIARMPHARHWVTGSASMVAYGLFVPVFFVTVGLSTDARAVLVAPALGIIVLIVAVATKGVGAGLGARFGGCTWQQARVVGAGMVARGEVALVMATLGLRNGLLNQTTFAVVIVMTLATTLLTPFLLKLTVSKDPVVEASAFVPMALELETPTHR